MESTPVKEIPARPNFLRRALENPVVAKELKGRMRGLQGFTLLTVYLALISFFILSIYLFIEVGSSTNSFGSPSDLQTIGKVIFSTVVLLELLMVSFIAPALTSGAISSEREHQTLDLLRVSLLSPAALVMGKLGSSVVYLLLLIVTAIPIQSLAFFLGGVGMAEMLVSTLMLVITAVFFGALGLFFSSISKRTLIATVSSYGSIILSFVLFVFSLFMLSIFDSSISRQSGVAEELLALGSWFLFSTNLFFAAIVSEAILVDDQSIFITTNGALIGHTSLPLLSPWIIYVGVHIILAVLLILLSIYFVSRPDR
jgi:ABC-type transport system involved in multi-copper enzyme maturation permease subunit